MFVPHLGIRPAEMGDELLVAAMGLRFSYEHNGDSAASNNSQVSAFTKQHAWHESDGRVSWLDSMPHFFSEPARAAISVRGGMVYFYHQVEVSTVEADDTPHVHCAEFKHVYTKAL